ncbi:tRNA (guanosine(37)-N1)-methyltransferase TrmD [Arcanobacterium hippocoleae]
MKTAAEAAASQLTGLIPQMAVRKTNAFRHSYDFPRIFSSLALSLVGKAQKRGLIDVNVHNLRDWTHDIHNTVDDTPFGGGAGMVMKADVWAEAIDAVAVLGKLQNESGKPESIAAEESGTDRQIVLAIPSPSGKQLKQADLLRLANAEQIIFACGRYEGIDARVAQYYAEQADFAVFEFSLGDYVLNGGEVAAVALIEGVARLVPGMMGNPQSLVEESHGEAGLLEYPNYTRPSSFRGIEVPQILTSGNHGAIARWRKDRALERTAASRPDLIRKLKAENLDRKDRMKLAEFGWFFPKGAIHPVQIKYRQAVLEDAAAVSVFATQTWPDACPEEISAQAINAYIAANMNPELFSEYLSDPEKYLVYAAEIAAGNREMGSGEIAAYLLVEISREQDGVVGITDGAPANFDYHGIRRDGPLVYLSKAYVGRKWRGSGIFAEFSQWAFAQAAAELSQFANPFIWLGTALQNKQAQRAYKKIGFTRSGTREFHVGDEVNKDVTMVRPLNMAK